MTNNADTVEYVEAVEDLEAINVSIWQQPFGAGILELVVACHEACEKQSNFDGIPFCTDN